MQIAYELTQQDFIEAYSVHRNRNAFSKWSRRLFLWIAGLFTAVVLSGFLIKPSVQAAESLMPLLVSVVMWIAILWILPRWTMRRQFVKQPGAHGARTVVLDASGAHWRWTVAPAMSSGRITFAPRKARTRFFSTPLLPASTFSPNLCLQQSNSLRSKV